MSPADGLRTALELFDLAVELLRTRLRRERPEITDEELDAGTAVRAWCHDRPGAEHGDAEGHPRTLPDP